MPIRDFGTVCDISVLTNQKSLQKAQNFFKNSGLYIPNPTYSWLSRTKLIEVRHQAVKYSLINQYVRKRRIYPINLPELYDEISRQIMFRTDHNVSLTDLRGLLLAAHLQLPILTFDNELIERIKREIGTQTIHKIQANPNWLTIRNILELYRELTHISGKEFHKEIEKNSTFSKTIAKIKKSNEKNFKKSKNVIERINQKENDKEKIQFHYLGWNIFPSIKEYYEEEILIPDVLKRICERCVLLVANPLDIKS